MILEEKSLVTKVSDRDTNKGGCMRFKYGMFKTICVALVCVILPGMAGNADADTYDFNSLTSGNLNGQDGWVTTKINTSTDVQVGAGHGYDGTQALKSVAAGPGGVAGEATLKGGSLVLPDFTGSNVYMFDFDVVRNWWGTSVYIAHDADNDGKADTNGIGISLSGYGGKLKLFTGEWNNGPDAPGGWSKIRIVMDTAANGNQGRVSVLYKNPPDASDWQAPAELQNINMSLDRSATDARNPANWNCVFVRFETDIGGGLDNLDFSVQEPPPVMDPPGNALEFDGANDYVVVANNDNLRLRTAITVEAWIKADSLAGWEAPLSYMQDDAGNESGYGMIYVGNKMRFSLVTETMGRDDFNDNPGATINTGIWYHIAGTYNGSTIKFYLNGVLAASEAKSGYIDLEFQPSDLRIGAYHDANEDYYFDGAIDEVRVWNFARSEAQIQADMSRPLNGDETGLAAYYQFDHTSGTWLTDLSGNGNHGTLKNMDDADWIESGAMRPFVNAASNVIPAGFTANWNQVDGATGYRVDVDDNEDFSSPLGTDIDAGAGTSFAVTDLNLEPGSLYYYRIRAQKGEWISPNSAPASFMLAPGNALEFDGANDYVSIPSSPGIDFDEDQNFTVSFWVKIPSADQPDTGGSENDILTKWAHSTVARYPYLIKYYNQTDSFDRTGKIAVLRYDGTNNPYLRSEAVLNDDKFHHIAFVKDGGTLYLYIDGILDGSAPDTTTSSTANGVDLHIGSRQDINRLKGIVDEIRIWNIARAEAQIQADMNRPLNGDETGLAAYYQFDHTSGTTLTDLTGNGNHGTLKNMNDADWIESEAMRPLVKSTTGISPTGFTANWNAVDGATGYRVDVDDNEDFSSPMLEDADAGAGTSFDVTDLTLDSGSLYHYRIRFLRDGWVSPNSEAVSFTGAMEAPGNALEFDGTDDAVSFSNNSAFQSVENPLTIEAWISIEALPEDTDVIFMANGRYSMEINSSGRIETGMLVGGSWEHAVSSDSVSTEGWHHVSLTRDGSAVTFYIDGVVAGTGNIANGNITADDTFPLSVGANHLGTVLYFDGMMDEVRVWNVARTQKEILLTMNKVLAGDEAGLVAYYNFDQVTGTSLPDVTGHGNGTLAGSPAWVPSGAMPEASIVSKNALSYAGTDDYVEMNDIGLGTSDFTIEGWIKPATTEGQMYVYTNRTKESTFAGNWFSIGLYGDKLFVEFADCAASYQSFTSPSALLPNAWYHIALVRNPTTVTLYLNGEQDVQIEDDASQRDLTAGTDITRFGGWPDEDTKWYKGQTDEFRVWNTARTRTEILNAMSKPLEGDEASLVAYYDFDQSGALLSDITGNGHDGVLNNDPAWVPSTMPDPVAPPNNVLYYDGTDDHVVSPGFITLTGNDTFTISAWVKTAAVREAIFVSVGEAKTYLGIGTDSSGNFISKSDAGTNNSGFALSSGEWYHLAAVFSGGDSTLYVNGVKSSPAAACANGGASDLPVVMGKAPFEGEMDEVRIWNIARAKDDIRNDMATDVSGQPGLLAYYTFDQGIAGGNNVETTSVTDMSGGHDATLNNFTMAGTTSNFVSSGVILQPTRQASAAGFSDVQPASTTLTWKNGNGSNRIVLLKADIEVDSPPVDRTGYSGNAAFSAGSQIGTGNYVVYMGTENSVKVIGLEPGKYYAAVYEFNGSGGEADYLGVAPAKASLSTLPKTVTVSEVSPIGATAVVANATASGFPITDRGFSTDSATDLPSLGSGEGDYNMVITGLKPNTAYNLRAYIKVDGETTYSDPFAVTTTDSDAGLTPTVHTGTESYELNESNITVSANVEASGVSPITSYGFFYGDHENLEASDKTESFMKTIQPGESFSSTLKNFFPGTYWVRSYANNSVGMVLGEEFSFTIESVAPKVTTSSNPKVTDMTSLGGGFGKSVTMKGGITDIGNLPVVVYGFVYANHSTPTVWDNLIPASELSGTLTVGKFFTAKVEYVPSGSYHFKAFAYSNEALGYGEDQNFSARQIRNEAHFVSYGEEFTFVISDESSTGGLPGDVNGDGQRDIADAVLALQIAAGITPIQQIRLSGDVNRDSRIGMEEAAYILQKMDD